MPLLEMRGENNIFRSVLLNDFVHVLSDVCLLCPQLPSEKVAMVFYILNWLRICKQVSVGFQLVKDCKQVYIWGPTLVGGLCNSDS